MGHEYNTIQYNTIIYLESITLGKVALTPEPRAHVENARLYKNNYNILYTILKYYINLENKEGKNEDPQLVVQTKQMKLIRYLLYSFVEYSSFVKVIES